MVVEKRFRVERPLTLPKRVLYTGAIGLFPADLRVVRALFFLLRASDLCCTVRATRTGVLRRAGGRRHTRACPMDTGSGPAGAPRARPGGEGAQAVVWRPSPCAHPGPAPGGRAVRGTVTPVLASAEVYSMLPLGRMARRAARMPGRAGWPVPGSPLTQ